MSKRRNFLGNLVAFSLTGLWSSTLLSQTKIPGLNSPTIKPKKPKNGARIALIAPAFNTSSEKIDRAVKDLTEMGFQVVPSKDLGDRYGYFSQTDQLRAQDLMDAFKDKTIYHEHYPARGYLSSMGYKIVLGLGAAQKIPKMIVEWPDDKVSILKNLEVNKQYGISYNKTQKSIIEPLIASKILTEKKSPNEFGISFIHKEDKRKPYTDDKLSAVLKEKGYPIARRTVAKYREQLDIPVARLRKEI